jgi:hypothetical protein
LDSGWTTGCWISIDRRYYEIVEQGLKDDPYIRRLGIIEDNREEPAALTLVPDLTEAILQRAYPYSGALEQVALTGHLGIRSLL